MFLFFFNHTATTEIYTLSLHDALPICRRSPLPTGGATGRACAQGPGCALPVRSEEHTSELQSLRHLVCRLLLEKKNRRERACHLQQRSVIRRIDNAVVGRNPYT